MVSQGGKDMKVLWFLIGFLLAAILVVQCADAATLGFGGFVHNGHSYSSDDKIDPPGYVGYGVNMFIEEGREDGQRLDFTYLGRVTGVRFGKRNNFTMRTSWEHAAMPTLEGRAYFKILEGCSLYTGVGLGYSFGTDGSNPLASVSYGLEKRFNSAWATEIGGTHFVTDERRHDLYGINIKYRF